MREKEQNSIANSQRRSQEPESTQPRIPAFPVSTTAVSSKLRPPYARLGEEPGRKQKTTETWDTGNCFKELSKETNSNKCCKEVGKWEPSYPASGIVKWCSCSGRSLVLSEILDIGLPPNPSFQSKGFTQNK